MISVAGPFQVDNGLGAHGIKADGWNAEDSRGGCKRHLRHARDNPRINPKHFEDWTEFLDLLDKELALPGYNDNLPHIPAWREVGYSKRLARKKEHASNVGSEAHMALFRAIAFHVYNGRYAWVY